MSNFKKEKNIISELTRAREAIRQKYSLLKREKDNFEKVISDTLKPVVSPLEKLVDSKIKNSWPATQGKKLARLDQSHNISDDDSIEKSTSDEDFTSMDGTIINSSFKSTSGKNKSDAYLSLLDESRSKTDNIYGVRCR